MLTSLLLRAQTADLKERSLLSAGPPMLLANLLVK